METNVNGNYKVSNLSYLLKNNFKYNISNIYNYNYKYNGIFNKGKCWDASMEKENEFLVNPETDVNIKMPYLKCKYIKLRREIKYEFKAKADVSPSLYIAAKNLPPKEAKELIRVEKEKKLAEARRYLLDLLHLKHIDEYQFEKYVTNRIKSINKCGFKIKEHNLDAYIISQCASHLVLENTKIEEIPCTCPNSTTQAKSAMMKILPVGQNAGHCMIYNSCLRTLFAAFKRQLKAVPRPDQEVLKDFIAFSKKFLDNYVFPHISEFDYSYAEWYNHLTYAKQQKMKEAKLAYEELVRSGQKLVVEFGLFCKREIQQAGGKNRAIANIKDLVKYIMGPVCWALEAMFKYVFPGYCGNKSGEDLEDYLSEAYAEGFMTSLQGDGSGFDLSQHHECKEIDRMIYSRVKEKVWHVDKELFYYVATVSHRAMVASYYSHKRKYTPFKAIIRGTVFSGSSDTTLMNTARMALYNHFTLQRAGLRYNKDYKLLAKGDDFLVLINNLGFRGKIEASYAKYWSSKPKDMTNYDQNYSSKGIGQILKFLKIGDFTTIDFCSNAIVPYKENGVQRFRVLRRPERMCELAHYSRKALGYNINQYKTYLLDLALSLEITAGNIPFYRNYIEAYRFWASKIKGNLASTKCGKDKENMKPDGHTCPFKVDDPFKELKNHFRQYGTEFAYSTHARMSRHKIPEEDVYQFLLSSYGLTKTVIEHHREILKDYKYNYDPVAEFIRRD